MGLTTVERRDRGLHTWFSPTEGDPGDRGVKHYARCSACGIYRWRVKSRYLYERGYMRGYRVGPCPDARPH